MIRKKSTDSFDLIYTDDEGIAKTVEGKTAIKRYLKDRGEVSHFDAPRALLPGAKLTRFRCKPLTRGALEFVSAYTRDEHKAIAAFRCSVESVINLPDAWTADMTAAGWGDGVKVLSDPALDALVEMLPIEALYEVGGLILARAELGVPEKKVSVPQPGSTENSETQ